jgi:hypothetical protein
LLVQLDNQPSNYAANHQPPNPLPRGPQPVLVSLVAQLSGYIASLGFAEAPQYERLAGLVAALPDELPGAAVRGSTLCQDVH